MLHVKPDPSYLPGLAKYVSFVDEAGHARDPNQRYICLAGLLATETAWSTFELEWQDTCVAAGLKKPFHMKDFAAKRKEFEGWPEEKRRQLLNQLVSAIVRARAISIGSVVSLDGYRALPPQDRSRLKDPHFLAFQTLTYQIAAAAGISLQPGTATMVYAHHPEHSDGLGNTRQLWEAVRKFNPILWQFMEAYVCSEQKDQPGLQAADLWAYELRHHFQVIRPFAREPRWPFKQFVRLGLNYDFTNDFITYHDEHGQSGLGRESRVKRWGEIDLYKPGFVGVHPAKAREIAVALHKFAAEIGK